MTGLEPTPSVDGYYWFIYADQSKGARVVQVTRSMVYEPMCEWEVNNEINIFTGHFIGPLLPEVDCCYQYLLTEHTKGEAKHTLEAFQILDLTEAGHTEHCAKRQIWGDGECECQRRKRRNVD